jgi:hypothetical protein
MKKKNLIIIISLILSLVLMGSIMGSDDKTEVANVIKKAYFQGAFNDMNTEAMRKGFHPDFAIFYAKGNELGKYPIDTWIKRTEEGKDDPSFLEKRKDMDCIIINLDITGGCASAKVEISKNGEKIYTDYLSLLKFDDGWRIVAKVYYQHSNK